MPSSQYNGQRNNDEFHFELREHIGVIGKRDNGWTKEVNVVAWNGGAAKIDVRDWDPGHERMSKGITLFDDEARNLTKALCTRYGIVDRRADEAVSRASENVAEFSWDDPAAGPSKAADAQGGDSFAGQDRPFAEQADSLSEQDTAFSGQKVVQSSETMAAAAPA